jgi:hypothetical protein
MKTKIAIVPIWTRLDNKSNIHGRRSPIRKVTHPIDTPLAHPHCRIDNRGCQPHQTHPLRYSLMTKKVVTLSEGYHLCNKKYYSYTHHTWQGSREDQTCQNGNTFYHILPMECGYLELKTSQTVHQLRHELADKVRQTRMIRMQSPQCINEMRPKSSSQTNPKVPTK